MWPGRIAVAIVLLLSALCLSMAGVVFLNLHTIESPERYLALGTGLVMLYMGGAMLAGLILPPKPKAPDAPIEIPPLEEARGRTSYRDDSTMWRNVTFAIGAIFLAGSITAVDEQPIVLVISVIAVGVLVGAGVLTWRQIQYGRARLQLDAPARRGDPMRGVITTSGFGWTVADRNIHATVELRAIRTYRVGRKSQSVVVARTSARASTVRDGHGMTFRFSTTVPVIETRKRRISWNVELETRVPKHRVTFLIDVT